MTREILPHGCWPSPISAQAVAGKSLRFGALRAEDGTLYWSESRPGEGGRGVIVRLEPGGKPEDVLPAPYSARSRVHEYGGGEFLARNGKVYFVDAETQDIFLAESGTEPRRLTDEPDIRFADMALDHTRQRLIAVAERHDASTEIHEPENFLAAIALKVEHAGEVAVLAEGKDFYSTPRLNPEGTKLAWLAWGLPHMPWEAAALYVAEVDADGKLEKPKRIAGGDGGAVFQPEWSAGGRLFFVWNKSGWGTLHAWDGEQAVEILAREAELLRPQWVFAMQSYVLLDEARAAAAFIEEGETRLAIVGTTSGKLTPVECDLRSVDALAPFDDGIAVIGASDTAPPAVVHVKPQEDIQTLRSSGETGLSPGDISKGEMLRFADGNGPLYALYYPPANARYTGPGRERPPTIILVHGGPTGMADRGLKLKSQYWTSRGFAVCDLDYSGSSGYGRAYRERLDGQWGVRDVEDVAALARYLEESDRADPRRMLISGGSAGGFTVLMALAKLDIFAAGACAYGVADLAQLQRVTHKFESGYLYGLTGTTPGDCEAVFAERSPVNHAGDIACPVIFFQGLEDKVVPPEQSRAMAETLRQRGVPVAYREFSGEAHGFRRAATLIEVLQSEYAFYAQVLGLEVGEQLPDIEIENWI